MNTTKIQRLILQKISQWSYFNPDLFAMPNKSFKPPDGIWYRVSFQWGGNRMVGMAEDPVSRELGAVVVEIFAPTDSGTKEVSELSDSLASHLKYYQTDKLELKTPSIVNVPFDDGTNRFKLNVRVPFRFN